MRTTPYGEPSDAEIDALRILPTCECGEPVDEYGDTCEICENENQQDTLL